MARPGDSFFGFDTRLPEDPERDTGREKRFGTTVDPFDSLNISSLRDFHLDDDMPSEPFRREPMGNNFENLWSNAALELDNIDTRDFLQNMKNSNSNVDFLAEADDLAARNFREAEDAIKWRSKSSPNFFTDKEDVDKRIRDSLACLIGDEDSFRSDQGRKDFMDTFTNPSFAPYPSLAGSDSSPRSLTAQQSPWTSVSSLPGPWSNSESSSTHTVSNQVASHIDPALTSTTKVAAPGPSVIKKVMTLEELETMIVPKHPPSNTSPQSSDLNSDKPFRTVGDNVDRLLSQGDSGVPQFSPKNFGGTDPRFGFYDPNNISRADAPRFPYGPGYAPQYQGMGPRGMGMSPPGMRPMYPPPHMQRYENSHQRQFMQMRSGNSGPVRGMPPPWMQPQPGYMNRPVYGQGPVRQVYGPPMQRHPMMSQVFVNNRYAQQADDDYDDDEEVAGWMTDREKDWVIKIQQSQIKTDNPYLDDYYHYVRSLKKSMIESGKFDETNEQDFIVPARMASEPKEERQNYFEGSLGKVCISSVFNPRKTVDVESVHISKNRAPPTNLKRRWFVDPLQKEKGHPKSLLLGIEELYKLFLELQDFSREIAALPEGQREQGLETRRNIINLMFDKLIQGTTPDSRLRSFCDTLKIRKGRELLRRILPIFFKEQIIILIEYCVRALPILVDDAVDKHEGFIRCLAPIGESLKQTSFKRLVEIIVPLIPAKSGMGDSGATGHNLLSHALKSQFTMNFLALLIACAELRYDTEWEGLNETDKEHWTLFITHFLISLSRAKSADVMVILDETTRTAVAGHVGRFPCLNKEALEACQEKLTRKETRDSLSNRD